jgi:hypothetical protein
MRSGPIHGVRSAVVAARGPLSALALGLVAVVAILCSLVLGAGRAQAAGTGSDEVSTLGRKELVRVIAPGSGRSQDEFARIDTGAARSSIDTDVAKKLGLDLEHAEKITVKSSLGRERRPVVRVVLQISGRSIPTRATVNNRSNLTSPILVGRHDLDGFVVDVSRTHLTRPGADEPPSSLSMFLTSAPLPPSQGALLAGLALGATLVVAMRQMVGVNTFGTFAPVLLALAFLSTGLWVGLLVTAVVCGLAVAVEPVIRRLRLPRVARLAVLIGAVTMIIAGNEAIFGADDNSVLGAAFPVVVLAAVIERFWECREEDGLGSALRGWLVTVGVAVLVSVLLVLPAVRTAIEARPLELAAALTGACILVGRYRGLRVSELVRFRVAAAGGAS